MTEPSGHRRPRASGAPSWASSGRQLLVPLALISVILLVAGLSIALGWGGVGPDASPAPSSVGSDYPVTPRPTSLTSFSSVGPSFPPAATASSTPHPSPTPGPGVRANWIQIERLGIDLKIVEGDGIDAPIDKAAHYPGTGWPGGGTNIYIYGHARTGMFLPLWDVKVGDRVILTLVDGTRRTYAIAAVLPKVPWDAVSYLAPTPIEQLTLQTSTSYGPTAPRFIAIAYPTP